MTSNPMEDLREQAAKIAEGHGYSQGYANFAAQIAAAIRAIPLPAPVAAPQVDPLRDIVFRYIDRMNDVAPECGDPAERILGEFARDVNAVLDVEFAGRKPTPTETPTAAAPDDGLMGRYRDAVERFRAATLEIPFVAEKLAAGQQFNAYESGDNDEDDEDEDREYSLCIGPITDARWLIDLTGKTRADLFEAAFKVAQFALSTATGDEGGK